MKTFYRLLGITLLVITTNNFVWFALTYWAYLSTKSVISTSVMGGIFLVITSITSIWIGSIVDHNKKKHAMIGSSLVSLTFFVIGLLLFTFAPSGSFNSITSPLFWIFIVLLLCGTLAGSVYNIAIPTLVPRILPEKMHDRANGMFGTTVGIAFGITSVISGISLAFGGMNFVLTVAIIATLLATSILFIIPVSEEKSKFSESPESLQPAALYSPEKPTTAQAKPEKKSVDIAGTIKAIKSVPGLFALIFFTTFNNFLGGVFFALMDAYGLSLMSVESWGLLWGALSMSFILGGLYISKKGLGSSPLKILFRNNIITWIVCIFFTIQPSIILLAIGTFIWMFFVPFTEAIEQTIFQKVVPPDRLGRVFGFAQSIEQAASPITAFLIGPITQFLFIPFMTDGAGVELIGGWYGTGTGRGIALVFSISGIVGLLITLIAMRSRSYKLLAQKYKK